MEYFTVKYIPINSCFAYISDTWLSTRKTKDNVVKVMCKDKIYYLSCCPKNIPKNIICINAIFAKALNINEGDEITLSFLTETFSLTSITVAPQSSRDRNILEMQVDRAQSTLLNQIRIVAKGQPIITWISKFSSIQLITESLEPNFTHGKLEQFTEVHVLNTSPNTEQKETDSLSNESRETDDSDLSTVHSLFKELFKSSTDIKTKEISKKDIVRNYKFLQSFKTKIKPQVFRVHFLPQFTLSADTLNIFDLTIRSPYYVFVPKIHVPKNMDLTNDLILCKIKKVPETQSNSNLTDVSVVNNENPVTPCSTSELIVRLFVLENILENCSNSIDKDYFNVYYTHSNVYVSDAVRITLMLKTGAKVFLEKLEISQETVPSHIEMFPSDQRLSAQTLKDYIKYYSVHEKLLLNSSGCIIFDKSNYCVIRFNPESCTHAFLSKTELESLTINVQTKIYTNNWIIPEDEYEDLRSNKISKGPFEDIVSKCEVILELGLNLHMKSKSEFDRENILIYGAIGSGKTTMCNLLRQSLANSPYFAYTKMIQCKPLKGMKLETLQKIITSALTQCVYYQPSVLFLENIESITTVLLKETNEENTPDSMHAARITDMLVNTIIEYQKVHHISVVATCIKVSKIGQKMKPIRGSHFFRAVIPLPNLDKEDRVDILKLTLQDHLKKPDNINWDYYGNKTEGWVAQDLIDLSGKAIFSAWKKHVNEDESGAPVMISERDMSIALKNSKPMSLLGIELYKGSGLTWEDVGGLFEVKQSLTEVLHWPLKYVELFKNAPIKLQSGILLYGMPGTGKTMIAKAINNECGVNLISIKGPELLSKYIGVSEESVRNVFERAHRAKPCVLFFDEFDSLAPRRGHDSTGVTDRVVNQLLTQLDGIEDREGIAVVAATSRPDLLDPALLRPGRLDKCIHCPLPTKVEREEILRVLCKAQKVDSTNIDFEELAKMSSGFTGADLNSVLTQARMSIIDDFLKNESIDKIKFEDIEIPQKKLVELTKSTQPSLNDLEKRKYAKFYAKFLKKGIDVVEDIQINQKATLA